jgi:fatty-acyl-CoA synthase
MSTFAEVVRARADDDNLALLFEDERWTYREWVAEVATRASLFAEMRVDGPAHIGVLLENVPDFTMWLGAAAVSGAVVVGINPTRRGAELERDIKHTDCQLIVTESSQAHLLEGLDLGAANGRVLVVDTPEYDKALESHRGAALPEVDVQPDDLFLLLFTSGTSGAPKAVITSHGRLHFSASMIQMIKELTPDDVAYVAMPLFHSNALFTGWGPSVVTGNALALRRSFSASGFLTDVRKFGATYFNYVGKPLAFILATPEQPDDADNPLRRGFGNEGGAADLERFAERFGCTLTDGYGQTETGASIVRVPDMPAGALGVPAADTISVRNPDTGDECPPAVFDENGRLLNAEEATGEIVNFGGGTFEGYYNNDEANRERIRNGAYWTGDLAYRDAAGFFYFAGRSADWVRVDGENFAAAPVEQILHRFPGIVLTAVYGVPDIDAGDRLMAAIQLAPGVTFDPEAFGRFLAEQPDLGPKGVPTYVWVTDDLPMTQTNKVLKRDLVKRRWHAVEDGTGANIWRRVGRGEPIAYEPFTADDAAALRQEFVTRGRDSTLT